MVCVASRVLPRLHSPCHLIPKDTRVKQSLGLVSGLRKATAPADFSTQQVWMVVSGTAYSSLWCKLISFVFTHRSAFFLFPPPFTLLRVALMKPVALLSARRTAAEGKTVQLCTVQKKGYMSSSKLVYSCCKTQQLHSLQRNTFEKLGPIIALLLTPILTLFICCCIHNSEMFLNIATFGSFQLCEMDVTVQCLDINIYIEVLNCFQQKDIIKI